MWKHLVSSTGSMTDVSLLFRSMALSHQLQPQAGGELGHMICYVLFLCYARQETTDKVETVEICQ